MVTILKWNRQSLIMKDPPKCVSISQPRIGRCVDKFLPPHVVVATLTWDPTAAQAKCHSTPQSVEVRAVPVHLPNIGVENLVGRHSVIDGCGQRHAVIISLKRKLRRILHSDHTGPQTPFMQPQVKQLN